MLAAVRTAGMGIELFGLGWNLAMQEHVPAEMLSRVYSYDMLGSVHRHPGRPARVRPAGGASAYVAVLVVAGIVYGDRAGDAASALGARRCRGCRSVEHHFDASARITVRLRLVATPSSSPRPRWSAVPRGSSPRAAGARPGRRPWRPPGGAASSIGRRPRPSDGLLQQRDVVRPPCPKDSACSAISRSSAVVKQIVGTSDRRALRRTPAPARPRCGRASAWSSSKRTPCRC